MEDPKDFNAARRGPDDPDKRLSYSLPFPAFDVEADAWRSFYTLQEDDTWVGMFEGVAAKPIGAKPVPLDPALPGVNQQWIHFQFQNLSDHVVAFDSFKTRLVHEDAVTVLDLSPVPADKEFHCVAAHSHEGSIYRPLPGAELEIVWDFRDATGPHMKTISLPEFSTNAKNWYCYLTVNADGQWSAEFEGTNP